MNRQKIKSFNKTHLITKYASKEFRQVSETFGLFEEIKNLTFSMQSNISSLVKKSLRLSIFSITD